MKELQERIHYSFQDEGLLVRAMTHSSYANEHHMDKTYNNERLEFLGDAVLELISSDVLFSRYPKMPEGDMSKKRAGLVCEPTLAFCARQMNLGKFLRLGRGEDLNGGRNRDSILSDALEALIGAIYLDGGFDSARTFVMTFVLNDIEHMEIFHDSKTALQELVQARRKETVTYELIDTIGPEHNRSFVVQAMIGTTRLCQGSGKTKQAAGQAAAYASILLLEEKPELLTQPKAETDGDPHVLKND